MALVDADYQFIYVDVGYNGRISDGGVFQNCNLSKAIEENALNIPLRRQIMGEIELPYVIVPDDAFPLKENIMNYSFQAIPREKQIFNYRLSRARRTVEKCIWNISEPVLNISISNAFIS